MSIADGDTIITLVPDPEPCFVCSKPTLQTCEVCRKKVCKKHYGEARCCRLAATLERVKFSRKKT